MSSSLPPGQLGSDYAPPGYTDQLVSPDAGLSRKTVLSGYFKNGHVPLLEHKGIFLQDLLWEPG